MKRLIIAAVSFGMLLSAAVASSSCAYHGHPQIGPHPQRHGHEHCHPAEDICHAHRHGPDHHAH